MVKASEIKGQALADLQKQVAEAKDELFNLRFQLATGQLENTARIKTVRRNIARMKGEIRAQEIAATAEKK